MSNSQDPEATEVDLTEGHTPPVHDPEDLIGTVFDGRFEIQSVIGQGGAGTVYRALQQSLGRPVALKISWIDEDHRGDEAARFLREASLAGSLQHPHVVTVHDFGRTDEGACYMVMELLDGISLRTLMGSQPVEPARVICLFDQMLQGLRHAHQAGLVHRDMKPGNVQVVQTDDRQEQIKILDFGLVRRPRDEEEGRQDATFVGTPHYSSPEQVRGASVDARADIYSVGVMLYRALTGCLPFIGTSPRAIAVAHVRRSYPPMEQRAPSVSVHPGLEDLVRKAMEKNPAHRFQDARTMQLALRDWGSTHLPDFALVSVAPGTQSMEMERLEEPRRSRGLLYAGALAVLAVVFAWWKTSESLDPLRGSGKELISASILEEARATETEEALVPDEVADQSLVRVRIQTVPDGAEVEFGGEILGRTPLDQMLQVRSSPTADLRTFHLHLDGYQETMVNLDLSLASVMWSGKLDKDADSPRGGGTVARTPGPSVGELASQRVDGVEFTAIEARAVLGLANTAELSELQALGIRTQQANAVIRAREFLSLIELGAAPGVGEKTLERLREGAR